MCEAQDVHFSIETAVLFVSRMPAYPNLFLHEHEINSKYIQLSCKYCQNVILPVIPARRTGSSAVVEGKSHMENRVKVAQSSSDPSASQVN